MQHRAIIKYSTESTSDFEKASSGITDRLKAVLSKREQLGQVASMSSVSKCGGLEQYEIAALVAVAQQVNDPEEGISYHMFRQDMEQAGFTQLAATLGLKSLCDREMLERVEEQNYNGENFSAIKVASKGIAWLLANKEKLTLHREQVQREIISDDDLPF